MMRKVVAKSIVGMQSAGFCGILRLGLQLRADIKIVSMGVVIREPRNSAQPRAWYRSLIDAGGHVGRCPSAVVSTEHIRRHCGIMRAIRSGWYLNFDFSIERSIVAEDSAKIMSEIFLVIALDNFQSLAILAQNRAACGIYQATVDSAKVLGVFR